MKVMVDSKIALDAHNYVKVIVGNYEIKVTVTHEGIVVDYVLDDGVADTRSMTFDELFSE